MKWAYCCIYVINFHCLGPRFKMVVSFKIFYILWLQYFCYNDTWQENVLQYSASATEAFFSPFRFSNFMTLRKGRSIFKYSVIKKEARSKVQKRFSLLLQGRKSPLQQRSPFCQAFVSQ